MANTEEQTNYKKQLDRAATGESETVVESANKLVDTVIDKVTEYVPAASEPLSRFRSEPKDEDKQNGETQTEAATGTGTETGTGTTDSKSIASEASAGPERPHHDTQIEEFLREQHRSKQSDELKKAAKGLTN